MGRVLSLPIHHSPVHRFPVQCRAGASAHARERRGFQPVCPPAQAEARRKQAAVRFEALQAKVIADIDRGLAVYQVAAKSRAGAEALLATQRKQQQSVEQQLKAGAADRVDVLTVQLELAASELAVEDGRTKSHQALGALEDAGQRPLAAWPDLEHGRAGQVKQEKP